MIALAAATGAVRFLDPVRSTQTAQAAPTTPEGAVDMPLPVNLDLVRATLALH